MAERHGASIVGVHSGFLGVLGRVCILDTFLLQCIVIVFLSWTRGRVRRRFDTLTSSRGCEYTPGVLARNGCFPGEQTMQPSDLLRITLFGWIILNGLIREE